ncbi:PadR family transcriptional regulator, partial [Streptomyces sp. NPDC058534]
HGLVSGERAVRWLTHHIESARAGGDRRGPAAEGTAHQDTTSGATGGLPRPGDDPRPDTPGDTAT